MILANPCQRGVTSAAPTPRLCRFVARVVQRFATRATKGDSRASVPAGVPCAHAQPAAEWPQRFDDARTRVSHAAGRPRAAHPDSSRRPETRGAATRLRATRSRRENPRRSASAAGSQALHLGT